MACLVFKKGAWSDVNCCIAMAVFLLRLLFVRIAIILFEVMYIIHAYDGVEY